MSDVKVIDGQNVRVTDAADAMRGYVEGRYRLPAGAPVDMVGSDGTVFEVPAENVNRAIQDHNWRFATKHEGLAQAAQGQQTRAAIEALGSELSFGTTDVVQRGMGIEGLAERRETTGGQIGSTIGAGLSLVAPGLEAGGAESLLGRAAEGALTPMMRLSEANAAVTRAAEAALSNSITNRAASAAIASGLGNAVEGAAYGFGSQLREEALGDADYSAGHLLAGAGMGALIGGAAGGALRGFLVSREASRMSAEEARLATQASVGDEVSPSGWRKWYDKLVGVGRRASEALTGAPAEEQALLHLPENRAIIVAGRPALDEAARALKVAVDDVGAHMADESRAAFGTHKPAFLDANIPKGDEAVRINAAHDVVEQLNANLDEMVAQAPRLDIEQRAAGRAVRKYRRLNEDVIDRAFEAAGVRRNAYVNGINPATGKPGIYKYRRNLADLAQLAPEGADLEAAVRDLYDNLESAKRVYAKAAKPRFDADIVDSEATKRFSDMHALVKNNLEDAGLWGQAGQMQREMNGLWSRMENAHGEVRSALRVGRDGLADPGAIEGYINKLDRVKGDKVVEQLQAWRNAKQAFDEGSARWFGTDSAEGAGLVKRLDAVHEKLVHDVHVLNTLKRVGEHDLGRRFGGALAAGPLVGMMAFGPVGAVAGAAGMAIMNPGASARMSAALMGARQRLAQWVGDRTGRLAGLARPDRALDMPRLVSRLTQRMLDPKISPDERRQAYLERSGELDRLSDPTAYTDHVAPQLAGLASDLPNHAQSINATGQRALQALRAMRPMPSHGNSPSAFQPFASGAPNDQAVREWAQLDRAVQDPLSLLDAASDGTITTKQVEAVAQVHPQLLQGMRETMVEHLVVSGGKVPRRFARAVSVLLGQPVSPAYDVAYMRTFQQLHAQSAQPQSPSQQRRPAGSSKLRPAAASVSSDTDRIAAGYPRP